MDTASNPWKPALVLMGSIVAVSTGAILARLADAPAVVIAASRVGLAFLILAPFSWRQARGELRRLARRDVAMAVGSGVFLAAHFATWISSLNYTSVANSVVLVNTIPLWVGMLTPMVVGTRVAKPMVIGIIISVLGSVVMCATNLDLGTAHFKGDLLAIVGAICAAFYLLFGKNLRSRLSLLAYVTLCYGAAALVLIAMVVMLRLPVVGFSQQTVVALIAMAVVSQIMGHTAFNWSLRWLSPGLVAVCLLGEPILATTWAYLLFGEAVGWQQGAGALLVLTGIYVAARDEI